MGPVQGEGPSSNVSAKTSSAMSWRCSSTDTDAIVRNSCLEEPLGAPVIAPLATVGSCEWLGDVAASDGRRGGRVRAARLAPRACRRVLASRRGAPGSRRTGARSSGSLGVSSGRESETASLELRLLGRARPCFGSASADRSRRRTRLSRCTLSDQGGLLARRPAGEIVFAQVGGSPPSRPLDDSRLLPELAARQGERDWTGALYSHVQSRVHVAISRRYFARLIAEARR